MAAAGDSRHFLQSRHTETGSDDDPWVEVAVLTMYGLSSLSTASPKARSTTAALLASARRTGVVPRRAAETLQYRLRDLIEDNQSDGA